MFYITIVRKVRFVTIVFDLYDSNVFFDKNEEVL